MTVVQPTHLAIRPSSASDLETILAVINDAAEAYRGVIPRDRWREPYMARDELVREIAEGVAFWLWDEGGEVAGVMGIQDRGDVTLIRHAYVRPGRQGEGIGTRLLQHLEAQTQHPLLVGTWSSARWAVRFYAGNGYRLLEPRASAHLLRRYWNVPERQIETSVVLAKGIQGAGGEDARHDAGDAR